MLNVEECLSGGNARDIWTRCEHHEEGLGHSRHSAVLEPVSKRVWIVGSYGRTADGGFCLPDHVQELAFQAPPLKILALESSAKNIKKLRSQIEELPESDPLLLFTIFDMRRSIEAKAQRKYKIT